MGTIQNKQTRNNRQVHWSKKTNRKNRKNAKNNVCDANHQKVWAEYSRLEASEAWSREEDLDRIQDHYGHENKI